MSTHIAANLSMPNLSNSITAKTLAQSSGSSSSSSSSSTDANNIGTTFLNLLVQELQNQDPTAPMDSTAMVGQMISLNQLNQLVGINQTLSQATTGKTSAATPSSAVTSAASAAALQAATGSASALAMMFPTSQLGVAAPVTAAQQPLSTTLSVLR